MNFLSKKFIWIQRNQRSESQLEINNERLKKNKIKRNLAIYRKKLSKCKFSCPFINLIINFTNFFINYRKIIENFLNII